MDFERQIIFFFSALGSFNGFLLSIFFAVAAKTKRFSNYFLALLLLALSIRVVKSVFFYFNPDLSSLYIQIGLSACILIGPFLYLYIKSQALSTQKSRWKRNTIPFLIAITVLGIWYPYWTHESLWSRYIVRLIYLQWLVYIILSGMVLKNHFKKLFNSRQKLNEIEIWLLSIFIGTTVIWLAYNVSSYTSYIVGALSFSFILYLFILLWVFRKAKHAKFFESKIPYENKQISLAEATIISDSLSVIETEKLFRNPNLKISDIAKKLNILPHTLSQFLNSNVGKSFTTFINEYRIEEAKMLLISNDLYTIEAIGYESGFNSKSTFFTAFKKITDTTPAKYREMNRTK